MEGCFTFQWGRFVFQMGGEGGGGSYKWGIGFGSGVGGGVRKKS